LSLTANRYRLGLFFSLAATIFVVIILWLTGGFRSEDVDRYACYFAWSVQGLDRGNSVLYNGVPIGRVQSIEVAPDGRLVEVVLDIERDFPIDSTIVAAMQITGITGNQVINLSSDSAVTPQPLGFDPPYPVIPVAEGAVQTVTNSIERVMQLLNEVDFVELSDHANELLDNLNAILDSETVLHLEEALLSNSGKLDTMLVVYTQLGRDLDRLVLTLEASAPGLISDVDTLATALHGVVQPLESLSQRLDRLLLEASDTMEALGGLVELLSSDPGALLQQTTGEGVWQ